MAYKNYMEEAVVDELNGVIDQLDNVCKCEVCRQDMVAWSLNRLPAKYVVTSLGHIYTKMNQLKTQTRADILVRLLEAAKVVRGKPRH